MATLPGQPAPVTGDRYTLSPRLGEHTREVLTELGHDAKAVSDLINSGVAQAAN
jgi:crotonobetainyl-CoA:carnitine CoA-transferase CaiB-like acyl-CoA transferase